VTLRGQLLLATLLVAALPLVGLGFVRQVEQLLRQGQEQALLDSAQALSAVLASAPTPTGVEPDPWYVQRAGQALFLDGYGDDWQGWLDRIYRFAAGRRDDVAAPVSPNAQWPLTVALAESAAGLHVLVSMLDDDVSFAGAPAAPGEAVELELARPDTTRRLAITPAAPGRFTRGDPSGIVHGDWQVHARGWNLELRIPARDRPEALDLTVINRGGTGARVARIETGGLRPLRSRGADLDRRLAALLPAGDRAWLVDADGWVLGHAGSARPPPAGDPDRPGFWQALLFERVAGASTVRQPERGEATARLIGAELDAARELGSGTDWRVRREADGAGVSVRAALPLDPGRARSPLLVLERDADALMLLANDVVLRLIGASLLTFLAAAAVLLAFALRLSQRIRRLQRAALGAVAEDGRVVGRLQPLRGRDELAGLSRSVAELLDRLRAQQQYLRTLADRLAHELRTPLTMIGSSLDNLARRVDAAGAIDPATARTWLERAGEGQRRLQRILQAMSEASRLEDALIDEPLQTLDLSGLVGDYVRARAADAGAALVFDGTAGALIVDGSGDLLAQLLDKLVDNALGFVSANGAVRVRVFVAGDRIALEVENDGERIDAETAAAAFEPMVSRRRGGGEAPHLGLGLFIARLIAARHGASIAIRAVATGTCVRVLFKRA